MNRSDVFQTVKLSTGIDANFLADTLTTDIELTDALFDLIDNSIDAARNSIIQGDFNKDHKGLPNSYKGFRIKLRFGIDSIIIEDNCIGIESDTLENKAFYTGKRSNHKFGIGFYGLGLKRALLKAGNKYALVTDNNEYLYRATFNKNTFSADDEHSLIAKKYDSKGKRKTLLMVTDLHNSVKSQINDSDWIKNCINELAIRYSIFIDKGLEIVFINSQKYLTDTMVITPSIPKIRNDGIMKEIVDEYRDSSVSCLFHVGVHEKYRFPGEWGHNSKENELLTKNYGIYYIFNDRVIVSSSTENKHGFATMWHPEYNGFVCLVYITGENPKDLPWNTAKTEIKINSPLFLAIRKMVEPLSQRYRSQAKSLINIWKATKGKTDNERRLIFAEKTGNRKLSQEEISAISRTAKKKTLKKDDTLKKRNENNSISLATKINSSKTVENNNIAHTKNWGSLLPKNQFPIGDDNVLNNLIVEATELMIMDAPHASCLLYRSLFEAAFRAFVKRNKLFDSVLTHYYSKGEGAKKNHSAEYKKNQGIDLAICSHWIIDNESLFYKDARKKLKICAANLRSNIKIMNGVVHGNQLLGNDGQVQKIRNETIELLEYLVATTIDLPSLDG